MKEALRLLPEGVLLTPAKYQSLLERIDQLERQARAAKPEIPSSCQLTAVVEGDVVRCQATFGFRTDKPKTIVALGCAHAWLRPGATLDGQLPALMVGDDGQILIRADTIGTHQAVLELEMPITTRGTKGREQGFEMGLPGAAITLLEKLSVIRSTSEVRVNGRSLKTKSADDAAKVERVPLGPTSHLEVTWKGAARAPRRGTPRAEARGQISVRITETTVVSDVELTLQAMWGESREWRIQMPPQVIPEVKEPRVQDERIAGIDLPQGKNTVLRIRLKEPSTEPLKVIFQIRRPRSPKAMAVGLFPVASATQQRGTILVSAPADVRVRFLPRGDVFQRDVPEENRRDNAIAEFTYGNLPTVLDPAQPAQAPLQITVEDVKGVVEARVEHFISPIEAGWRIATKIAVTPVRARVRELDVELPVGFDFDAAVGATPASLVDSVAPLDAGDKKRTARIKLAKEQTQPFTVTLPGTCAASPDSLRQTIAVPRPLHTQDRGGQITLSLPEDKEIAFREPSGDAPAATVHQYTWRSERFPAQAEFGWRIHRPELPISGIIDAILHGEQIHFQHQIRLHLGTSSVNRVTLTVPSTIADGVRLIHGGSWDGDRAIKLTPPLEKEHVLELEYFCSRSAIALTAGAPNDEHASVARLNMPFIQINEATQVDSRMRLWTDPGTTPEWVGGPWEQRVLEAVADHDTLPSLVLRTSAVQHPLIVGLHQAESGRQVPVMIEDALVQVELMDDGTQAYRACFHLGRMQAAEANFDLPGPVSLLHPEVSLNGKRLTTDGTSANGRLDKELHVPLGDKKSGRRILEIRYRLPPALTSGSSNWVTSLQPPIPRDGIILGRARWLAELPSKWMAVSQRGSLPGNTVWVWRRGLFAPEPNVTAMEAVLQSFDPDAPSASATKYQTSRIALVGWQTRLQPVELVHAPRQAWLFVCSALFVALGLILTFAPLANAARWTVLILLVLACAMATFLWPGALPAVFYGCQPGIAVLILVLGVQWALQRRYRRQVVFLPAFSRTKSGSSLVQRGSGNRPPSEPSTVDGPTKRESSIRQIPEAGLP